MAIVVILFLESHIQAHLLLQLDVVQDALDQGLLHDGFPGGKQVLKALLDRVTHSLRIVDAHQVDAQVGFHGRISDHSHTSLKVVNF